MRFTMVILLIFQYSDEESSGGDSLRVAESFGRHGASQPSDFRRTTKEMRLFYVIMTALLFLSLGLLEVVAARGVPVTP
jgi:hypothetical protein